MFLKNYKGNIIYFRNLYLLLTKNNNDFFQKQKETSLNDLRKRVEKISERIESTNQSIVENERKKSELDGDVKSSKEKMETLQKKLENIIEQLGDAKTDKHEDSRRKRKQEIVEKFKSKFPGVFDRMLNLCQPIHNRFVLLLYKITQCFFLKIFQILTEKNRFVFRMCKIL